MQYGTDDETSKKYELQHTNAFVSYNRENECLFGCKLSRTTCSVREDKLCPPSLSKSSFARSNSSVGTQKGLGPGAEPLVRRSGGSGWDGPLKLKAISPGYDCPMKRQICYLVGILQSINLNCMLYSCNRPRSYNRCRLGQAYVLRTQKIKHECRLVRVKSETITGQVYPRVGLDCVGLGQIIFHF